MKLKRFAAGFVAAVMAFAVLGTPLGDILPFVRASMATTAGAESYGDIAIKCLIMGQLKFQDIQVMRLWLIYHRELMVEG